MDAIRELVTLAGVSLDAAYWPHAVASGAAGQALRAGLSRGQEGFHRHPRRAAHRLPGRSAAGPTCSPRWCWWADDREHGVRSALWWPTCRPQLRPAPPGSAPGASGITDPRELNKLMMLGAGRAGQDQGARGGGACAGPGHRRVASCGASRSSSPANTPSLYGQMPPTPGLDAFYRRHGFEVLDPGESLDLWPVFGVHSRSSTPTSAGAVLHPLPVMKQVLDVNPNVATGRAARRRAAETSCLWRRCRWSLHPTLPLKDFWISSNRDFWQSRLPAPRCRGPGLMLVQHRGDCGAHGGQGPGGAGSAACRLGDRVGACHSGGCGVRAVDALGQGGLRAGGSRGGRFPCGGFSCRVSWYIAAAVFRRVTASSTRAAPISIGTASCRAPASHAAAGAAGIRARAAVSGDPPAR